MIARLLVALWLTAPFQCASEPDPSRRLQDSPAEALWDLAEAFRQEDAASARERTLRQIVERYPDSAEAEMARMALGGREPAPERREAADD